jgi:predicted dienelactone hydrolase
MASKISAQTKSRNAHQLREHTMSMLRREILVLLCLGFIAVNSRAAGVRELVIPSDGSGPQIVARLWTPCASPPGPIAVNRGTVRLTIQGVKNCAPLSKHLPLIVISHGGFEDLFSHHDTAEFLGDAGFAVVTFNHTQDSGSSTKEQLDNISSFLVRPREVKRVINFVLSSQALVDIDPKRIGFFGHSRGGYTGLVLAGAVPNFKAPPFPCPEEWHMCRQMRDNDIPEQHDSGFDPRIKAFVIADPVSFFPDKTSLQKVTAPIQLWSSERGGMGVRSEDVLSLKNNLPATPEFHRPANSAHLDFLFPCSDDEARAMSFQCIDDPPGFDRAGFHRQFNAQILEFFRKHLSSHEQ